jgi:hypothetical protein
MLGVVCFLLRIESAKRGEIMANSTLKAGQEGTSRLYGGFE